MKTGKIIWIVLFYFITPSVSAQKILRLAFNVPVIDGTYITDSMRIKVEYKDSVYFDGNVGNNGIYEFNKIVDLYYTKSDIEKKETISIMVNSDHELSFRIHSLNLKNNILRVDCHNKGGFYFTAFKRKIR